MEKIFLSSDSIPEKLRNEFWKFVQKKPKKLKVAYISNASDAYQQRDWALKTKEFFLGLGTSITDLDLKKYHQNQKKLSSALLENDIIWVGPGDIFPLCFEMQASGFAKIIPDLIKRGIIYCGESAGAIVAGPNIGHFLEKEELKNPKIITSGLGLVNFLPLPHWEDVNYIETFKKMMKNLKNTEYEVAKIKNNEVIFVRNSKARLLKG